jgi:hypothetical protein
MRSESWIDGVGADWHATSLVEAPEAVVARGKRAFQARAQADQGLVGAVRRFRATLVFDSRQTAGGLAGARDGGALGNLALRGGHTLDRPRHASWQLLYRGSDVDIDMLIRPNADGETMSVRGQALTLDGGPVSEGRLEVLSSGRGLPEEWVAETALDHAGEFALPRIQPGRYHMLLRLDAREVELTDIDL